MGFFLLSIDMGGAHLGYEPVIGPSLHLCRSEERRVGKECRSRWSPVFKRTEGQEDEDPTLGVACVGGSGGSTGMASSLHKRTVIACKISTRNKQVHHIPDSI